MTEPEPISIAAGERARFDIGGFGVVWKIDGADTGGRFAVVHHPLAPRALAAPLHRHSNEDEYSYVVEGMLGALLGEEVVIAARGTWVFKPRGQWHTFWNAGETPCEIVEIISPAGFEDYFRELAKAFRDSTGAAMQELQALASRYGLETDPASIPVLCERFGLRHPAAP
jgi:mannose-6-phosphate isomerase-like protein (cupin superfamily)